MLWFLVLGVLAGALTGVPIGPVNVAVIDAAYRHTLRRALAVGFGGACGDFLYCALGVLGVTPVVSTYPGVETVLYAISGAVLLVYGFVTARSHSVQPTTGTDAPKPAPHEAREMWQGFRVGVALIVLNPAAIVTWVLVVSSMIRPETRLEGLACAIGVFVGSFGWFSLVAQLTHKGKHVLGDKAAWIPRLVGIALMLYAVYLIATAVKFVVLS